MFLVSCTHWGGRGAPLAPASLQKVQSQVFATADRQKVLRAVIASMQNEGFIIDRADEELGLISGIKRSGYTMIMSVAVEKVGEGAIAVNSNIQINGRPFEYAAVYSDFFDSVAALLYN